MTVNDVEDTIRVIKKYPNRRVYDTQQSKYIKIDDIRDMVIAGIAFKVIDSQSKKDVTRSVLLQIILEQESDNNPLFTSENLQHFIRYYSQNHHQMFSEYLTQSLSFFNQQFSGVMQQSSADMFSQLNELNQKNIETWQGMQNAFFEQFTGATTKKDTDS